VERVARTGSSTRGLIELATATETLRCAPNHGIWSSARGDFVHIWQIEAGDAVQVTNADLHPVTKMDWYPADVGLWSMLIAAGFPAEFFANRLLVYRG
jgi:hypothetical protein